MNKKIISIETKDREEFLDKVCQQIRECESFIVVGSTKTGQAFCMKDGRPRDVADSLVSTYKNLPDVEALIQATMIMHKTGQQIEFVEVDEETLKQHPGRIIPLSDLMQGKGGDA